MAKDTVTLSIEEYNRLRDFEREVKSGKVLSIAMGFSTFINYYTENSIIECLINDNNELRKDRLYNGKTIYDVKKMSIWEFLKWRKS